MDNLKTTTSKSIKWQVATSFLNKGISFATTIVLARILGPSNYGLFALAFVIIGSFGLFKSLGIESALIQRKNNIDEAANTAFFIIPFLGVALYSILFISAPAIAAFLNSSELVSVLRVLGCIFVLWSLSRVPLSLLEKQMKFAIVSVAEIVGTLSFSVIAILLAKTGHGVWSLVFGYLTNTIIFTCIIWASCKWIPDFRFNGKIARELFNFGKFIFLGSAVWFLKMNLDNVLVGKLLGTTMLGLYAVAFNISNFMSDHFGNKVYRVVYPAYSKLQDDSENLKAAYLKVIKHVAAIAVPFACGIFVLGGSFVRFAYGEKWIGAGQILKVLTLAGLFNALTTSNEAVLLSKGKSKVSFMLYFIQVAIFFAFIAPASRLFGLVGVGTVVTIASFLANIFSFYWIAKIFSIRFSQLLNCLRAPIFASLFMSATIIVFSVLFTAYCRNLPIKAGFIILFLIGAGSYIFSLYRADRVFFKEIKSLVLKQGV